MTVYECVPGPEYPPGCRICGGERQGCQFWHFTPATGTAEICQDCAAKGNQEITRIINDSS